ncbi:Abi-alpha family protein [Flavobacterium terrisoli]|uniref:Abi-alpha family protein n=1 Tax=Flavobacterium terrisoli TaxID=3242195 RepID=UPI00254284B7|nr:Abi-alpha family protein [Flavobacterium buctense]
MSKIEKIIDNINLPKKVVESTESFLKTILGSAVAETGEMITDQIRYRRFKNQVNIFSKAQTLLESKAISPKTINLKTIVPLIDYSSLEEDEQLQVVWANVIANLASYETEDALNTKCIEVLKEITPNEIILLDFFYSIFKEEESKTLKRWKEQKTFEEERKHVHPDNSVFAPWKHLDNLKMSLSQVDLYIDRLISFGIFKYELPNLHESIDKKYISDTFSGRSEAIDVPSYELESSERVHFTNFGVYFVNLCKYST